MTSQEETLEYSKAVVGSNNPDKTNYVGPPDVMS